MTACAAPLPGAAPRGAGDALVLLFALLGGDGPRAGEEELRALVRRARERDPAAERQLYEQLVGRVFRALRPMVRDEAEAEDLTQDALLRVLSSLHRYQEREGSSFTSWALAVAINTARHRFRRKTPIPTGPEALDGLQAALVADGDPALDLERREARAAVLRALWEIPERDREILTLRYGAELNASEIAAITHLSPANVRKICERWRERLASRFEELRPGAGGVS